METIAIKAKEPFSLELIASILSRDWPLETTAGKGLVVHGDRSRAYIHFAEESKESEMFELQMDYSEVELAKRLLTVIADNPAFIVDNDFGTVLSGDKFVARCKAEKGWDWRHPSN